MGESRRAHPYLESVRLRLIAATPLLVAEDLKGGACLAAALKVDVPDNWPPELYDRRAMEYAGRQVADPLEQGWAFWYLIDRQDDPEVLIGVCGFKGRPDREGAVEIGYSMLSQYRNQGFATEAVSRLVSWAFSHGTVREVAAETFPYLSESIRVLEKNGFIFRGRGSEHGVIRYSVQRSNLD
jgi:RimJ/RimL family protein N-acetyltransferase